MYFYSLAKAWLSFMVNNDDYERAVSAKTLVYRITSFKKILVFIMNL